MNLLGLAQRAGAQGLHGTRHPTEDALGNQVSGRRLKLAISAGTLAACSV